MQEEEPSILASLGIDPTTLTPPPPGTWDAALAAAFDPAAEADPTTVPDMDDTIPPDEEQIDLVDTPSADTTVPGPPADTHGHDDAGLFGDEPSGPDVEPAVDHSDDTATHHYDDAYGHGEDHHI